MNSQHRAVSALQNNEETKMIKNEASLARIDKYYILRETQTFNDSKFSDENSRCILVELIYLLNQGIQFNGQEVETIFFRITKLFQSSNPKLRQIMYKALKVLIAHNKLIMPSKYAHILLQCISKDLMSDDQEIQLQALRFIPYLESELHIQQVERYIHNALLDANLLISSAALIVGIHIINKFPNIVWKWFFGIVQRLGQTKQNQQYHAVILLHEMQRSNYSQFIKILIQMTNEQQQPLVQLQIIKFIEEIILYLPNQQKQSLINYLLQSANNEDRMLRFQSIFLLTKIQEIRNQVIQPLIISIYKEFRQPNNFLIKFISLHLVEILSNIRSRIIILDEVMMNHVKAMAFSSSLAIAHKSLLLCVPFYGEGASIEFKTVFENINVTEWQYNYLNGLFELISVNPNTSYEIFAINFLQMTTIKLSEKCLVTVTLKIIQQIMLNVQSMQSNNQQCEILHQIDLGLQYLKGKLLSYQDYQHDSAQFLSIKQKEMK